LSRVSGTGSKNLPPLIESVDLAFGDLPESEMAGEKDEKFSVRGPTAATLVLRGTPIQEQLVEV
jgi:hypothetical protein